VRVLVVADHLRRTAPGGIGTYLRGLLAGLAAARSDEDGPEITLLASRAHAPADALVAAVGGTVAASRLPGTLLTRAWDHGLARAPAPFDVVHAPSLAAPPSPHAPLAVAVHDLAWRQVPHAFPARGRRWHHAAFGRAVRRAALLLAPTPQTADAMVAAGARSGQVRVVDPMYGCDHLPAPDGAGAAALLDGLGVRGPYLLSVGTIEPRKNLQRLLQAYERARSQLPDPWPLVVVGPPGWGGELQPVPGAVLAGPVGDAVLAALYAGARCVAYVPLLEGFGLPAVEAMAAAVPVVASPMPSTAGAALEVDPYDVVAVATALVQAAADDRLRARLVTAGLVRTRDLTWVAAARRHTELWESLL
jgi:glycosyltransferase involved in cell wall biosynthesis